MITGIYKDLGNLGLTKYKKALTKFNNREGLVEEELRILERMPHVSTFEFLRLITGPYRWYRIDIDRLLGVGCYYKEEVKGLIELLWDQGRVEDLRKVENKLKNKNSKKFITVPDRLDMEMIRRIIKSDKELLVKLIKAKLGEDTND